jgi:hypothetical protein
MPMFVKVVSVLQPTTQRRPDVYEMKTLVLLFGRAKAFIVRGLIG